MDRLLSIRNSSAEKLSCLVGLAFFTVLVLTELIAILSINNGVFVYTLDDPYIHLALAENILEGHYGINTSEYSAPSSSIIWPFLLAPFSWSPYSPLVLNFLSGCCVVVVYSRAVAFSIKELARQNLALVSVVFTLALILCTNLVGLVFIGMEHTLQVLMVALIAFGLMLENRDSTIKLWLLVIIAVSPLIRFENMAISAAALLYLMDRGYRRQAVLTGITSIALLVGFSLLLLSLGLDYLPTSVNAKLNPRGTDLSVGSIFLTLLLNHGERQGLMMLIGLLLLGYLLFLSRESQLKKYHSLLLCTVIAVLLHFLFGKTNWYNRYEIYIWTFFLLTLLYTGLPMILARSGTNLSKKDQAAVTGTIAVVAMAASWPYLSDLTTLPTASNNIFRQQYQMHRFATDFYDAPVAVNDIGFVSYQNDHYVLDLFGLASAQALEFRRARAGTDWMIDLSEKHGIELIMIYDDWFPPLPEDWIPLGKLLLGTKRVTAASEQVSFYATSSADISYIRGAIIEFSESLPEGVQFVAEFHEW